MKTKSRHPELWQKYKTMKSRCQQTRGTSKEVMLTKRWKDFDNFVTDMLPTYKKGLCLLRKDYSRNYSKSNCKWGTLSKLKSSVLPKHRGELLEYKGERLGLATWARRYNLKVATVYQRFHILGWTLEQSLTLPLFKTINSKKEIEYKGKMYSLKELAKSHGLSYAKVYQRWKRRGYTLEEALAPNIIKTYSIDGESLTLPEISIKYNINYSVLYQRMTVKKMTINEAIRTKPKKPSRKVEYKGKMYLISKLGDMHSIEPSTLRARLDRGWEVEKALNTPVQGEITWE